MNTWMEIDTNFVKKNKEYKEKYQEQYIKFSETLRRA